MYWREREGRAGGTGRAAKGETMAKFYYGGQAVIEGVMMRGRSSAALAVRRPDESIYIYEEALSPRLYQSKFFRMPFVRGVLLLWEMLVLGTRLMTLSANIASGAEEPASPSPQLAPTSPDQQSSTLIGSTD